MTKVEDLWREIAAQSNRAGLFRRVDDTHPLDLYAGIEHQWKRVLLLVVPDAPPNLPPPGIVEVSCNQRGDSEWAIIVQLSRPDFEELFGRLCQDLIDATRQSTPEGGAEVLLRRLGRWRRLLELSHRRTLSELELRGLIGELWFLKTVALPRFGPQLAVHGWVGPQGAAHDFLLGHLLVEIKTYGPGSHDLMIASLDQLDAGNDPLYLAAVSLAGSTSTSNGAITTTMLVADIRESLETDPVVLTEFDLRLAEAGYADGENYTRTWYQIFGARYFAVRDGFPRLVQAGVPTGVHDVVYLIDLRACAAFEEALPTRTL